MRPETENLGEVSTGRTKWRPFNNGEGAVMSSWEIVSNSCNSSNEMKFQRDMESPLHSILHR